MQQQQSSDDYFKKVFCSDNLSKEKRRFLVDNYRKFSKLFKQIKYSLYSQSSLSENLKIQTIADYTLKMQNLPIFDNIWRDSNLDIQSQKKGFKCQVPRYICLTEGIPPQAYQQKKFQSDKQIILKIIIQQGADLLYTKESHQIPMIKATKIIGELKKYDPNMQLNFTQKCILRMIAIKSGKIDSDCVTLTIIPKRGENNHDGQGIVTKKIDLNIQQSNTQQSSPFFLGNNEGYIL